MGPSALGGPGRGEGEGRTTYNVPLTDDERAAGLAIEGGRVKGRVDGWTADDIGSYKVQTGLFDPYFLRVGEALKKAAEEASPGGLPGQNVAQQLLGAVLGGAELYGKTGNPYGAEQVPNAEPAEREFIANMRELQHLNDGSKGSRALAACIQQGRQLDDVLQGKLGSGLVATVELRQGPDGRVAEARLASSSGLPAYDQHVLRVAERLDGLPTPPDAGMGLHPEGFRSLWAFEGRVKFKRPIKEWNPTTGLLTGGLVQALYGLACPGLGPPITFDEATGQIELIDLSHPKFTCRVRLLRTY